MTQLPTDRYRVIVFYGEETAKGERAWKRVFDKQGPAQNIHNALVKVAKLTETDASTGKHERPITRARKARGPRYADVALNNVAPEGGNSAKLVSRVRKALRNYGVPSSEVGEFTREARGGGLDHGVNGYAETLTVAKKWVTIK
jgi:hypothetical protein